MQGGSEEVATEEHDTSNTQRAKGSLWRRVLAGVLAVIAIAVVVAAVEAVWVQTTFQDEDAFVATFESLQQDEAVVSYLSIQVSEGVLEAAGVEVFLSDSLPDELSFLVVPLTGAVEDWITRIANEVISSDAVASAWSTTLRLTHKGVSAVLSGNDSALVAEEGRVAIDLDEIGAVVVERVEATGLDLPEIDVSLGEVVLYESEDLAAAQAAARWVDTMGWLLPILALVLVAGAIWVSPNHRWMTQLVGFGSAVTLLFSLAALRIGRYSTINGIDGEIEQEAAGAVWDLLFVPMVQSTWAILLLAFIIGLIAWVTGPSPRARRVTAWTSRTLDAWRRPTEAQPSGFTAFLVEWKRTIQVVVVVLGLVVVLVGPAPSGLVVILTAAVVLGLVVLAEVFAGPENASADYRDSADL